MENTESLLIINGPSKFDLMNGLFDDKIVTFTISDQLDKTLNSSIKVKIVEVGTYLNYHNLKRRDDDGFNVKMIVVDTKENPYFDIKNKDGLDGWYNPKTRRGNVSGLNW